MPNKASQRVQKTAASLCFSAPAGGVIHKIETVVEIKLDD
jgi:hypothetical protein